MKKLTRTGAVVLIIAATLLVYWPALRNGFVWDDTALVLRDPLIRSWRLIPEGFRHFLFLDATASNFYRPIQRLSFVFDYQVYGFAQPWGWHLTSILIHAGAGVALFFAAEKLLAITAVRLEKKTQIDIAFVTALIWAIHPLQTSAVTYVAGRADPLAALFGFTGLALGLANLRNSPGRPANHTNDANDDSYSSDSRDSRAKMKGSFVSWPGNLSAAACFFLAMLSKESGIIFLPLWLLILAWRKETRRALVLWGIIGAVIFAGYAGLRFTAESVPPPKSPPPPFAIRPILAARAFAGYAGLLVAPVNLRMERDVSTRPLDTPEATLRQARALEYQTLAGVLLLLGFAVWLRHSFRRDPAAALCLVASAVAYLPISNLFSLNATIAEHWLYVPGTFLLLAVFLTVRRLLGPKEGASYSVSLIYFVGFLQCWAALLGVRTFLRQPDWHDQRTFIERTLAAGGNSPRMLMNLGNVELAAGHQDTVLALYREALRRSPDQPIIWLGLASVLLRAHDLHGASEALDRAEKSPMLAADCLSLRATLKSAEPGGDSGELLRKAVDAAPENWGIRKRYIEYLHERSNPQEALRELGDFLQRHPFRAESWRMLAALLEEQHHLNFAAEAWREAARRDVRDEESRGALQRLASTPSYPREQQR